MPPWGHGQVSDTDIMERTLALLFWANSHCPSETLSSIVTFLILLIASPRQPGLPTLLSRQATCAAL